MNSLDQNKILGVHIDGNKLRMIEASKQSENIRLTTVAESTFAHPLEINIFDNDQLIPSFSDSIKRLVDEASIEAKDVRLALDRQMVILEKINVDQNLDDNQLKDHIEWELDQFLISTREEYNVGYEFVANFKKDISSVLVVSLRKKVVDYLKTIFENTPIDLNYVDLDIFSEIRGVREILTRTRGFSVIVHMKEAGFGFTILNEGKYFMSSESSMSQINQQDMNSAPGLALTLNNEFKNLFEKLESQTKIRQFENVYLAGEKADPALIPHLKKLQETADIGFPNPFQNIQRELNPESELLIQEHPENFLAAIGMLLC